MGAFLQGYEFVLLLLVLLLILGPSKLPALARSLGQAVREFRRASQGLYDEQPREAPAGQAGQAERREEKA